MHPITLAILTISFALLSTLGTAEQPYSTIVPSRDGTTWETNGVITPLDQDMRNFYIRNNDGIIEVQLTDDTEIGLQSRVQRTGAWESGKLIPEFRTESQMSIPIPAEVYAKVEFKDLKSAKSVLGKRDLHGGRVYFSNIGEHLPTEDEPWLSGKVIKFLPKSIKVISAGGKEYPISTKGHDNAEVVVGALGLGDIKPFEQQAFLRGKMIANVFHADEVTLRPLPLKKENPELGRYLFIGDSISGNYDRALRQALKGKLNLVHPPTNCGPSSKGLANMGQWLGPYDLEGKGWDVISFNFGHWDSGNDKQSYQSNLETIISLLRKTGAKLIFVTTCPIPQGYPTAPDPEDHEQGPNVAPRRKSGTMDKYINPWALEVMARHPDIAICDQHSLIETEAFYRTWYQKAGNAQGKGNEYGDLHIPHLLAEPVGRQLGRLVLDVLNRESEALTPADIPERDLTPERQRPATKGMNVADFLDLLSNDERLRSYNRK